MKQKNIFKNKITAIIICLVLIIFIMLALRSLLRAKAVEFKQISSDKSLEATINNTNVSMYFDNITDPMICIQQWQENNMSLEDAVLCIDKYMRNQNKT